jgi:hypothetical protein
MSTTIQLRQSPLHFRVVECRIKPETEVGLKVYDMRVSFGRGKIASMRVEAETLSIALEILETLSRQYSKMDAEAFDKYRKGHVRKRTVFRFTLAQDINKDAKDAKDRVAIFKPARTRGGEIELAFGRKKGKGLAAHIILDKTTLDAISRLNRTLTEKQEKKIKKIPPAPIGSLHAHLKRKKQAKSAGSL